MNKKIKIIELLNKIANKKDLPNSIKFYGEQYDLDRHGTYINYGYTDENNCDRWLIDDKWEIAQCLNDEVEILEDNTEEKGDDTKMNKSEIKEGDTVRVRSTSVPKGFNFTYKYGIGSVGKVLSNAEHKDFRSVIVEFGNDVTERDSYYENDLDLIDNTEEIEELENWFIDERKEYREFDISAINLCFKKHQEKINELVKAVNEIRKDLNK